MGNRPSIIDEQVNEHCIFMYSTTVCSFCTKAKTLLDDLKLDYGLVELNKLSPGQSGQVVLELREKTKQTTVPQIFINGKFIGGYMELKSLTNAGTLFNKLSQCTKPCRKE